MSADLWRAVSQCPALPAQGVQCWMDQLSASPPWCTIPLVDDEPARAARLLHPQRRAAFIRGRQLVRFAVAPVLGVTPTAVPIAVLPSGKSVIRETPDRPAVHISLAHTDDWVVVAVSRAGEVGVDIESTERRVDHEAIIRRYFAAEEQAGIAGVMPPDRVAAFIRVWARKEAIAKGTGDGLAGTLSDFAVPVAEGDALPITRMSPAWADGAPWWLHELHAPPPTIAALAVRHATPRIDRLRWTV